MPYTQVETASRTPAGPTPESQRFPVLDILRGFALFGILWMNIWYYSAPAETLHDQASDLIGLFLARGKFFRIFSFLFGVGFILQMDRAQARGAPVVLTYIRRLFVLLLFGLAHRVLFYPGEVLVQYALAGFLLLLFRNCPPRWLLASALLVLCYSMFFWPAKANIEGRLRRDAVSARQANLDSIAAGAASTARREAALSQHGGSYRGSVKTNIAGVKSYLSMWFAYVQDYVLVLFLLGAYAGRRRILTDVQPHLPFIRKVMWWTLCLGVPASLATVVLRELSARGLPSVSGSLLGYLSFVAPVAHALFYLSALTLLLQKEVWLRRLKPLAYAGRMALTNYLMQTLIWMPLYMLWGLGLRTRFSASLSIVMTLIIFAIQVPLSIWWLRRYRFGPMEWLWRSLTYWKAQPMRLVSHA